VEKKREQRLKEKERQSGKEKVNGERDKRLKETERQSGKNKVSE